MLVVWASGFAQSSLSVDFESDLTTYTDWTFKNIAQSATVTPHTGTHYGKTSGTTTAYVQTKNKVEAPHQLTFYISKESGNTTSSNWKIQVSTDGKTWTDVKSVSAISMEKGQWLEVTQNLEKYKNNYVKVYYNGNRSTAIRCIDDITLSVASTKTLKSLAISGDATKKAYNDGEEFDPTGLVVTGTYDDASTAAITDGITWTKTPATLAVGNTSCSVTATVNGVTSPAYEVTGLSVTKTISLSIDPATSTVVKAPVTVSLTATPGATVYYTTNGDEPSTSSEKYVAPFEVTKSGTTVKAIAVAEGAKDVTAEAEYTIKPDQPVFSDESKTFKDAFDVTLSLPKSTDATSKIYYAIGASATAESSLYEGPINISAENDGDKVILHAVVVDQYGNVGKEKYCTYTKTTAIVFDFTGNWDGVTPLSKNDDKTAANVVAGKELKVNGIVMTATNGSRMTCLYGQKTDHNLRVYSEGGSITFTAPEGYNISEVTFNNKSAAFNTTVGTYQNGTWTGNEHAVTFTANKTVQLNNAKIKLVAVANPTLTLDENAEATVTENALSEAVKAGKAYDVTLTRTLTAGVWNTICLPFDVTAEQIANVLKSEGNVKEYGGEDASKQTIYFKAATTMKAGVPYLIKPTEGAKEFVFKGVTIKNVDAVDRMVGDKYNMCGVFGKYAMNTNGTELFLKTDGKFYVPAEGKETMKGFRAYFLVPKNTAGAALNLSFGDATGINGVAADAEKNVKVYNVNGQYVGTNLEALPKGLYIVGGKKVLK